MSDKNIEKRHHSTFEQIKEQANDGKEFWTARKLSKVLDYSEYRHFLPVIDRAKEACRNSGHNIADHFEDFLGMVEIGSGAHNLFFNNEKTRKDLTWADAHNPFFVHGKHGKRGNFVGLLLRRMSLQAEFVIWSIGFSD